MPSEPTGRLRLRDIRNISTFRLTLLLGLVALAGIIALSVLIYALSARELNARSDHILRAEAGRLVALPASALPAEIDAAIARSTTGLNYYGLLAPDGRPLAGNLRGVSGFTIGHAKEIGPLAGRHGPIRQLAVRGRSGDIILIARDVTVIVDLRRRVTIILLGSALAIAVLMLIAAVALSLAPLRRVDALQRAAQEIAAGRLDRRMPILGRGDELDLFASTVNAMIEEVGRVVAQVKGVTDAIAHDLRTPLTRVRSNLYRALQTPGIDPDVAALAEAATADLGTVLERFTALLRIAELEAGARRSGFATVDLVALIGRVRELYEPLGEDRGIAIAATATATAPTASSVQGDEQLLFEAISNLVDNAIKFGRPGGHVALRVRQEAGIPIVEVEDDGPGIAADQRQAVLRRFHRGADTAEIAGVGLGLSVVQAISHLHNFTLILDDAEPGLIVRIVCHTPGTHPISV